jgi:hypothetical protein
MFLVDGIELDDIPYNNLNLDWVAGPISLHAASGEHNGRAFNNKASPNVIGTYYNKRLKRHDVVMKNTSTTELYYLMSLDLPLEKVAARYMMRRFVFAFPTLGKTTLAEKESGKFADIDFWYLRKGLGVAPFHERGQRYPDLVYSTALTTARYWYKTGRTIFLNDPWLLRYSLAEDLIKRSIFLIPKFSGEEVAKRMLERDPNTSSAEEFRIHGDRYISEWIELGKRLDILVIPVTYVTDVLPLFTNLD